jgi:hypothetical protein
VSQAVTQVRQGGTDDEATPDSPVETVSPDDAYELLSNQRRRYALHHLKRTDAPSELGDLSEHVAFWENDVPKREVNAAERKRVYTSLQQFHLPKMEEKGIVEFDQRAGTIELTPSAEDLDLYLEVVTENDVPWSQYYLGLTGINAAIVGAVALNVWPLSVLPDIAWALFVLTTIGVSAAVHVYHDSDRRLGERDHPPEMDAA